MATPRQFLRTSHWVRWLSRDKVPPQDWYKNMMGFSIRELPRITIKTTSSILFVIMLYIKHYKTYVCNVWHDFIIIICVMLFMLYIKHMCVMFKTWFYMWWWWKVWFPRIFTLIKCDHQPSLSNCIIHLWDLLGFHTTHIPSLSH